MPILTKIVLSLGQPTLKGRSSILGLFIAILDTFLVKYLITIRIVEGLLRDVLRKDMQLCGAARGNRVTKDMLTDALDYYKQDARIVPIIGAYYRIPDPEIRVYLLSKLQDIVHDCIMAELSRIGQEMDSLFDDDDPRKYNME